MMKKARIDTEGNVLGIYNVDTFINIHTSLVSTWILIDISIEDIELINLGYRYIDNIWVSPEPIEPVIEVPQTISHMKFKMQLLIMGITIQSIIDAINAVPSAYMSDLQKQLAIIKLETATHFERYNQDLILVAQVRQISEEQLNTIFIEGNKLQ